MKNSIELKQGIAKVKLEVVLFKDHEMFIAYSSALDLAGQGNSKDEAINDFLSVFEITVDWAIENNTFNNLLLEHGWTLTEKPAPVYVPPVFNKQYILSKFNIDHSNLLESFSLALS